jgi:glycosyltransferase involved in cell wall biosynthesis
MNTNNLPEVSIALTTYNHEAYIAECLDSILSQEVDFNFEIVVGEDLSTDNTRHILYKYADRYSNIRILERRVNLGYTKNFDDTMQQCSGKYIAIFDGDDIMLPGKLQKQKDFLDLNKGYVLVAHLMDAFDSETKQVMRTIKPKFKKDFYELKDLISWGSFFANSSKMFRKWAYPKEGINPNIRYIADWAVTLDIASKGKIGFIWDKMALYRVHGVSIMQSIKGVEDYNDKKIIIENFVLKHKEVNPKFFNNQWAYAYLVKGIDEMILARRKLAFKDFIKSLLHNPFYSITVYYYLFILMAPSIIISYLVPKKHLSKFK